MKPTVDGRIAEASPTEHCFMVGQGYVHVGALEAPRSAIMGKPVRPPAGAGHGSEHVLEAANGNEITLSWRSDHWRHPTNPAAGNRLGWSPDHLGASGWSYLRKA